MGSSPSLRLRSCCPTSWATRASSLKKKGIAASFAIACASSCARTDRSSAPPSSSGRPASPSRPSSSPRGSAAGISSTSTSATARAARACRFTARRRGSESSSRSCSSRSFVSEIIPGFDRLYLRIDVSNKILAIDPHSGQELPLGPAPAGVGLRPARVRRRVARRRRHRSARAARDLRRGRDVAAASPSPSASPARQCSAATPCSSRPRARNTLSTRTASSRCAPTRRPCDARARRRAAAAATSRPARAKAAPRGARGWLARQRGTGGRRARRRARRASRSATARSSRPPPTLIPSLSRRATRCPRAAASASSAASRTGATNVYAFTPPLVMQSRRSTSRKPRFVASSGNGALVDPRRCGDDDAPARREHPRIASAASTATSRGLVVRRAISASSASWRSPTGASSSSSRRARTRRASSRSSAAADVDQVPLAIPAEPQATAREVQRGMWLEGFEEREPGVLGGWVEAGGPIVGVRIALDGKVTMGEVRDSFDDRVVVGGRFAIAELPEGRGAETRRRRHDAGRSSRCPRCPQQDGRRDDARVRTGRLRARALAPRRMGKASRRKAISRPPSRPRRSTAPLEDRPRRFELPLRRRSERSEPRRPPTNPRAERPDAREHPTAPDTPQRPPRTPGPVPQRRRAALAKDELGLDNGIRATTPRRSAPTRGERRAPTGRARARWLIRFDDRFDPDRRRALERSHRLALARRSSRRRSARRRRATLRLGAVGVVRPIPAAARCSPQRCRAGIRCALYAVIDGQPILADPRRRPVTRGSLPRILPSAAPCASARRGSSRRRSTRNARARTAAQSSASRSPSIASISASRGSSRR